LAKAETGRARCGLSGVSEQSSWFGCGAAEETTTSVLRLLLGAAKQAGASVLSGLIVRCA